MPHRSWSFSLPVPTPSLNTVIRAHWRTRAADLMAFRMLLRIAIRDLPRDISKPSGRRALSIVRVSPRQLDRDNCYGGCKGLLDAMVREGLLIDDNDAHLDLHVSQEKGDACTRITLTEVA